MRKFLLLLFFLGGYVITALAGQVQLFKSDGTEILPNSILKVIGSPSEPINELVVYVSNLQDFGGLLNVEQKVIENINGSDNRFYWNTTKKTSKKNFIDAFESNKELVFEFNPNNYTGKSIIEYSISLNNSPEKSFNFTIEYQIDQANSSFTDLNNYEISEAYPNPVISDAKFDYIFPLHYREAKIIIRSLLGSIIVEQSFEGTQGTMNINLQDVQNGIYFYSIVIESEIKETKKLIIKH